MSGKRELRLADLVPADGDDLEGFCPRPAGTSEEGLRHSARNYIEQIATGDFGNYLPSLHRLYERENAAFYEGKLPRDPLFVIAHGRKGYGWYSNYSSLGGRFEIGLARKLFQGGGSIAREDEGTERGFVRLLEDIVRHEMVHMYCVEVLKELENSFHGHGPTFAFECNQVGKVLGIPPVRSARDRSKGGRSIPSCAQWPLNVRDPAYYEGAYLPPAPREEEDEDPRDRAMRYLKRFLAHGGPTADHLQLAGQAAVIACRLVFGKGELPGYPAEIPLSRTIVI